ncbi:MAG: hypothetical protein WD638_01130 [Nitriliruptoraceae bacterium]
MSEEAGKRSGGSGDEPQRPPRDRFGALADRPWYKHPMVLISAGGLFFFALILYTTTL